MVGLLKQLSIVAGSYEAAFCSRQRWRLVGPMLTHLVEELIRADGLDRGAMIERALAARHRTQSAAEQGASFSSSFSACLIRDLSVVIIRCTASSRLGLSSAWRHSSDFSTAALDRSASFFFGSPTI